MRVRKALRRPRSATSIREPSSHGGRHVADHVGRCVLGVSAALAHRTDYRGFVGGDGYAPPFRQKERAKPVTHLVPDARTKHVEPDAIHVRHGGTLYHADTHLPLL